MTTASEIIPPFTAALGQTLRGASPAVERHLASVEPILLHTGVLRRLWHRGVIGALAARALHLDGGLGKGVDSRFDLRNELSTDGDGTAEMLWQRTHYRSPGPVRATGSIRWDSARGTLIDTIGSRRWLEVELVPRVEERAVVMVSRRQWLRIGRFRVRFPRFLFGGAKTREWEEPDGSLALSLTLRHPWFGDYAGYEVVFDRGEPS